MREKDATDVAEIDRIGRDPARYARVAAAYGAMRIECVAHWEQLYLLRGRAGRTPYLSRTSTTATNAATAATSSATSPHDLGLPQFIAQPTPKRRGTTTEGSSRLT